MPHLSFIFTEDSFRVDRLNYNVGEQEGLKQAFLEDRYRALFQTGFEARRRDVSPSFRFLQIIAENFVRDLINRSELEVAREWTKIELSDETFGRLERAVPFGLGTEYITNYDEKDKTIDDYLVSNA